MTSAKSLEQWFLSVDATSLSIGGGIIVLTVLFRGPLAKWAVNGVSRFADAVSFPLSDPVRDSLVKSSRVIVVAAVLLLVVRTLFPNGPLGDILARFLASLLIISIFGIWYQLADTLVAKISPHKIIRVRVEAGWATRVSRLIIIIAAFSAVLAIWDIEIGSALTGVGVFGAGLAIASQDQIRNLMAGMSNMSEERFEINDRIEVVGVVEGVVERVDLRSTRIRGLDRVPHHVPNAELANSVVRNLSRRDHRRVYWKIGLVLDTTDAQLDHIANGLRAYLVESNDFVVRDDVRRIVHVEGLSDSSVDLSIYAYSVTSKYETYVEVCDRLTRTILRLVREAGTDLAYPTQTLHVETSHSV